MIILPHDVFSVKPFLTDEEYLQTDFLVNEFKSGLGKDLQKILLERGKTKRNWVSILLHSYPQDPEN